MFENLTWGQEQDQRDHEYIEMKNSGFYLYLDVEGCVQVKLKISNKEILHYYSDSYYGDSFLDVCSYGLLTIPDRIDL